MLFPVSCWSDILPGMFRTVLVHLQEQLYKLYIAFGICRYMLVYAGTSGC
jgi:hypothetical protein